MPVDSTVQDLNDLHRKAKAARGRLEPSWFMNLAYFQGSQWLAWEGGRLYSPLQNKRGRVTVTDNRIQPIVRKELARLTKNRPILNVIPNSPDEEDANAAQIGNAVLEYLWRHLRIGKQRLRAYRWAHICGAGFLKTYWDPTVGEGAEVLMAGGQMLEGPQGGPVRPNTPEADVAQRFAQQQGQDIVVKRVSQGDIRLEVRSPFQMFPDPLADSWDEIEWCVEESVKSREYVQRRFNVDVKADTPANPGLIEARMGSNVQSSGGYMGVRIREYWCKPCPAHPDGYRCVWLVQEGKGKPDGQVLAQDSQPFDPMPYVMFSAIPVPGRLWPTSITEQLRGPQTELNKLESQITENGNRVGNPTVLASKQAVQDPAKFLEQVGAPGGTVFFDDVGSPNAIPSYLQAPPLPEYLVARYQQIEESMQEISGQHDVTNAQVPPGVTAAAAIELLQEADETMLAPDLNEHEDDVSLLGEKLLRLVGRYYTDSRTVRIAGDNGAWQIFDFRGAMLRGNTRCEVQAGSAFPRSKAAKQAQMQDFLTYMAQTGQPLQGRQLAQFLQDWEFGGSARFIGQFTDTETQCNRENALMAVSGQPLPTNEYDDDEQHVANHESYQRQAHYSMLPPQGQQAISVHVAQHRQKLMLLQQQQTQMMLQASGQPTAVQQQQQQAQDGQQAQLQQAQQQAQAQQQQAQGQQQLDMAGARGAQQQVLSDSQARQQLEHQAELHQQRMQHQQEAHQARMAQLQQSKGAQRGRAA